MRENKEREIERESKREREREKEREREGGEGEGEYDVCTALWCEVRACPVVINLVSIRINIKGHFVLLYG